jgi:lipopolysaccharide biosynthesis protein
LKTSIKTIAFHLPQFHPIPENDQWWGKGFTDWTNVVKAKPQFEGHYQPHLPADLGFYDLRVAESREAQANLARQHGLYGFCYYHYWFEGRRLLERPVNEILASGRPDFPFCLCWANETWSRTWLGHESQILIKQTYSEHDDRVHARWLANTFLDHRYIRQNNRPVFLLYGVPRHPNVARFCDILREASREAGDENPYLIGVDSLCSWQDTRKYGFDTTLHFEPQLSIFPDLFVDRWMLRRWIRNSRMGIRSGHVKVFDYREGRRRMSGQRADFPQVPCLLVGWDNTARRGKRGSVLVGNTPEVFEEELRNALTVWIASSPQDDLFFINAWNEWAEGNHLEPDLRFGHGYVDALKRVLGEFENGRID